MGRVTVPVLCVGFLLWWLFLEEAIFFSVGPPVQLGYQWGKPGYLYIPKPSQDAHQSVQLLSCVQLFVTPRTAAHQASLSITNSWSLLKLTSIKSVMPSNHLILVIPFSSCPQSPPSSGSFQMSQFFASGGQSFKARVSASTSVLPMNTQDWSPLEWTGWISLQSKGLLSSWLQVFS